jgi:hypothetical protein
MSDLKHRINLQKDIVLFLSATVKFYDDINRKLEHIGAMLDNRDNPNDALVHDEVEKIINNDISPVHINMYNLEQREKRKLEDMELDLLILEGKEKPTQN